MSSQRYQQLHDPSQQDRYIMDEAEGKHKATPPASATANRSWQVTVITQIFALAWIAPIMVLLVFNLNGYIIGASAWCPSRDCYPELFNMDRAYTQQLLKRYNKESHNLLGALQLVSKALEVWFEIIASFFVYLVAMEIASRKEGLSVGYIMVPFEYSRLPFVFDFLMYKIAPSLFGPKTKSARAYRRRIYLLLMLALLLCGICNLMGPSTAVLVLPALQYVETQKVGNSSFSAMNAASPPTASGWFMQYAGCDVNQSNAHNYSCAQKDIGYTFDSWIASFMSTLDSQGSTQQDLVSFGLNDTYQINRTHKDTWPHVRNPVFWAPSRQIASSLSDDWYRISRVAMGYNASELHISQDSFDTYAEYNKSLEVYVQRVGPILGAIPNYWRPVYDDSNSWTVEVEQNRQLRCYSSYKIGHIDFDYEEKNFTKCITIGTAWGPLNKFENFSTAGLYNYSSDSLSPAISVSIFSSDQAFFLPNGTVPSWMPASCFSNGTIPAGTNCDWIRLGEENAMLSMAVNRSRTHVNTIELRTQGNSSTGPLVIDFVAHTSFALYTVDCSPLSNPYFNIETQGIQDTNETIHIDPAWILAAWSADAGGTLYPNHTSTVSLTDTTLGLLLDLSVYQDKLADIDALSLLTAAQTLSLIDFSARPSTLHASDYDTAHPFLYRNARINVYAYQISSRTAVLGIIVAIIGIVVTLLQFVLALVFRRPFHSPTHILVSALAHAPRKEFEGKDDEVQEGKVRFHVRELEGERLTFRHVRL